MDSGFFVVRQLIVLNIILIRAFRKVGLHTHVPHTVICAYYLLSPLEPKSEAHESAHVHSIILLVFDSMEVQWIYFKLC